MARKKIPAADAAEPVGFGGFGSQALPFLRALAENNDRTWFATHKETYLAECDAPLRELVAAIGAGLSSRGIDLAPRAKAPVFRIYRDTRFGKNKTPYKTNIGAALHRGGDKSRPGLLYVHIEPGRSFLAAGFYQPDPPLLKAFRTAIAREVPRFERLLQAMWATGLTLDPGEPLVRVPKGFEKFAGSAIADVLRKRSFTTSRPLADDDLERQDLPDVAVRFATDALPLLTYFEERVNFA